MRKPTVVTAKGWAIAGDCGLYLGWWFTRREAIKDHTTHLGKTWDHCRAKGDRAVKVSLSYTLPKEGK